MLPNDMQSNDLRVILKNKYVFRNATRVPLAFQKHYFFQIREPWQYCDHIIDWNNYSLERRQTTSCIGEAANNLKVMYLSESMLFAWMYSVSKPENIQSENDWFLQHVIRNLFLKAMMQKSVKYGGVNAHLIYAFDPMNMRFQYPMESDYVATCAVDEKAHIVIDHLQFHGHFDKEWRNMEPEQRKLKFEQIVVQLQSCVSAPPQKANRARPSFLERPKTKQEFFDQKRFAQLWLKIRTLQEKPQPLVEMKVFDRNNKHFEAMTKPEISREMKKA